ncbi:MAG: glycoside hydrolase family 92 protein [Clostridia bacterium]|nr:glycoside hydrolase family 92 protein [Clostridia bacterium]
MDVCKYVDVFHGCGEINLPEPQGAAATWHFVKAISGNTTPAATLPFGKYSCCMYTTGYPTGYGENEGNYSPASLPKLKNGVRCFGLSHFHQSGTGAIDYYYNYAVTKAFFSETDNEEGCAVKAECGQPGYYSVTTQDNIKYETTVSENAALHRFTFPRKGGKIAVDFTNNGLFKYDAKYFRPLGGKIKIISGSEVFAEINHNGLIQYFFYRVCCADKAAITKNGEIINEAEISFGQGEDVYGVVFVSEQNTVSGRLSVSFLSAEHAEKLLNTDDGDFDTVRNAAYAKWNAVLSKIEITADSEREKKIFYSNLYHSFVKPSDRSTESPFEGKDGFVIDYSTMWDIYKTQLPLVFTFCPEISEKIMESFLKFGINTGRLPHTVVMKEGFHEPSSQACMLAEHSVCDAYYRGVKADYDRLFDVCINDMCRDDYEYLYSGTLPKRLTHLADASEAARAICDLGKELSKPVPEKITALSHRQQECFDPETGLMKADFDYYEGNVWNYSFRLMNDMEQRIELAGGKEEFVALLDRFFGFTHPESLETRFEGFNNEPDMETPYAYYYAGRTDRVCEIAYLMRKYMFTDGRGGIPGNNDSGGLSSCYIWNCIGIFPVTGQNLMLIGSPAFSETVLHLPGEKTLTVERRGNGIYTKKAFLNGKELEQLRFTAKEMMNGGKLIIETQEQPASLYSEKAQK